ncbi:NAD-dependent epimerase/dehydratase family protein [Pseudanabaena sp. PCC 6802]|uniref:NAD-dependent epimerase/dehydratase family protein n=1 Tax=Pseudanabaena sp. PCC 6802 TaxID=118173 RepID=UPI000347745B|nr:NAD-dependent epimerase/dehydratase family protein [Pseudanabaena sp. PCC 6802]
MAQKILVLGGHGFIGKSLMKVLSNSNYEAIALSRRNRLDLTRYEDIKYFLRLYRPKVIVNLAAHVGGLPYVAKRHAVIFSDNTQMALNLYRAIQDVCPESVVINPLSNCCYPGQAEIYTESDWLKGDVHPSVYSYGNAKRFIYNLAACYKMQFGIDTRHFFIPNAFGPGDSTDATRVHALNGMIIRMLKAEMARQPTFEIWGSGAPIREWIYVEDVAKLLALAIDRDLALPEPINLAQGKGYTIRESAEAIALAIGFRGELVFRTDYPDGAPRKIMDTKRFQQVFGDYQFTDTYDGICKTVDYYQNVDLSFYKVDRHNLHSPIARDRA